MTLNENTIWLNVYSHEYGNSQNVNYAINMAARAVLDYRAGFKTMEYTPEQVKAMFQEVKALDEDMDED